MSVGSGHVGAKGVSEHEGTKATSMCSFIPNIGLQPFVSHKVI